MTDKKASAREFLREFKGDAYVYGLDCSERLGELVKRHGARPAVVMSGLGKDWAEQVRSKTQTSLAAAGLAPVGEPIKGPAPNAPREDVCRIRDALAERDPDVLVAVGGGSLIDGVKAASALLTLGTEHPDIDAYFGVGQVSKLLADTGAGQLRPLVAAQLAASSAAHLTKYSNVTDTGTWQKKLIVDDAIVPAAALFDYAATATMSRAFTSDGALDGIAHALEVFYGAKGETLERVRPVATLAIDLCVSSVKAACSDPADLAAREALGLGTDLGGYAIMIGGTNGGHLTSFSLVDVLSHGRACALMNPYYTVFFAPAIEPQLRDLAEIFRGAGYLATDTSGLHGRELGVAVAESMLALSRAIGFPTTLNEVAGFSDAHIERALSAAKNPQLEMKLKNMPVPLSAELIDEYMGPILAAARTGDFGLIKNLGA